MTEQQFIERALGSLPTVLHNRLSDGSRTSLSAAFLDALHHTGVRFLFVQEDTGYPTESQEDVDRLLHGLNLDQILSLVDQGKVSADDARDYFRRVGTLPA